MAHNELLTNRVREALALTSNVEEKKMFRGIAFMVNGKLCVTTGDDEMMCRIDPQFHDAIVETNGCREMMRNGKVIKGYVFVNEAAIQKKKDFNYWITMALAFNEKAKASKKKSKTQL